jgi:cell wall assembly regulator SMI1
MDELHAGFRKRTPMSAAEIDRTEDDLGVTLPSDYRAFFEMSDGGEGFIGEHHLILWRTSELRRYNLDYEVAASAPGLLGIGSDGGGEMFAFDTRFKPAPVVMVPFVDMSHDEAVVVADSFTHLLRRISRTVGSLLDP